MWTSIISHLCCPQSPNTCSSQCTDVSLTPLCLSSLFLLPSTRPRLPINLADTVSLNRGGTAREATPRTTAVRSPAEGAACTVSHSSAYETPHSYFTPISTSCMLAMPSDLCTPCDMRGPRHSPFIALPVIRMNWYIDRGQTDGDSDFHLYYWWCALGKLGSDVTPYVIGQLAPVPGGPKQLQAPLLEDVRRLRSRSKETCGTWKEKETRTCTEHAHTLPL